MSFQQVLEKLSLVNDIDSFDAETIQLLTSIYSTSQGQHFLNSVAAFALPIEIIFSNDESGERRLYEGDLHTATQVLIDYDWVESDFTVIQADGTVVNASAEAILIHELTHAIHPGAEGDDPAQHGIRNLGDLAIVLNPELMDGLPVENEIALGFGTRISYWSTGGGASDPNNPQIFLTIGDDYSPRADDAVDVVFVDKYDACGVAELGTGISLSDYSDTNRYLIVLGNSSNAISGGSNVDFLHTNGGDDTVYGSDGNDYYDGGSNGTAGDLLNYEYLELKTDAISLVSSGSGDAVFEMHFQGSDTTHYFTDFETITLSDTDGKIAFDSDAVLDALTSESITIIGGEGRDQIDARLLGGDVVIDFTAGEMHLKGESNHLTLVGFEDAVGGAGDDKITGDDQTNFLMGNEGADALFGGGADDFIFFDAADGVNVNGGAGRDVAVALGLEGVAVDMLAQGLECVIGGGGADVITVAGNEIFAAGGAGNDRFTVTIGSGGPKVLWGGADADEFNFVQANPEANWDQLGIAVVTIEGLTADGFANLKLEDLGLAGVDLSKIDVILINPDQNDTYTIDGQQIDSETLSAGWDPAVSGLVFEVQDSTYLGAAQAIQSLYQTDFYYSAPYYENYEYFTVAVWRSGQYELMPDPGFEGMFWSATSEEYLPLDASHPEIAAIISQVQENAVSWFESTPDILVQSASDLPLFSFFVVGGDFDGTALVDNGAFHGFEPNDPGPSPFDWLLAA